MVNLTNQQVLDALAALRELAQARLPVASSLRVYRILRAVEPVARDVEAVRDQIILRHAVRDEAGQLVPAKGPDGAGQPNTVVIGNADGFRAELNELLAAETRLDAAPLTPADLGQIEIAPANLLALGPLFAEDAAGTREPVAAAPGE